MFHYVSGKNAIVSPTFSGCECRCMWGGGGGFFIAFHFNGRPSNASMSRFIYYLAIIQCGLLICCILIIDLIHNIQYIHLRIIIGNILATQRSMGENVFHMVFQERWVFSHSSPNPALAATRLWAGYGELVGENSISPGKPCEMHIIPVQFYRYKFSYCSVYEWYWVMG